MFSFLRRGPGRLTPRQARQRAGDGTAVLPDVRHTPEWRAGHAPGAPHPPPSRLTAGAPLPAVAQGRPVVTVRRSGHRSRQAARLPARRGAQATDVIGGMAARAGAGLPVTGRGGSGGGMA